MGAKDPFRPLIFIIVSFTIAYSLYYVIYKSELLSRKSVARENVTNTLSSEASTNELNRSKKSYISGDEESQPLLILILASNARSGSTLLSEILSTAKDSILFFEPIWPHQKESGFVDGSAVNDYLSSIFTCDFSDDFEQWLKTTMPFNQFYHSSVPQCLSEWSSEECLRNLNLKSTCQNSRVRIAKVVRSRLSWVEDLLQSSALNVKVIHLMRDPRGSITSMQELFWNWTPSLKCGHLWKDMQDYDLLVQKYPNKLTNVTHEELSLNPTETMERLNEFLYGRSSLSQDTSWYIKKHMNTIRYQEDPLSTFSVSKEKYQSWRWKINGRLLSDIESEPSCRLAIKKYGHRLFGTIYSVSDHRVPLRLSDKGPSDKLLQLYT